MKHNEIDDFRLRDLLKKELSEAPVNPWFVKKVMNRLPERESQTYTWIERASYIIAAVVLVVFWILFCHGINDSRVLTGRDIMSYIALTAASFFLAISYIAPKVRRWIADI